MKEPVDAEIAHFRALDQQVEKYKHQQAIAKIKGDTEVAVMAQRRKNEIWRWVKVVLTPLVAIALATSATCFIVMAAKSGPPDSPEVVKIKAKDKRAKACTAKDDNLGVEDHVWWPDAAGGEGLCLPKDQKPPQ